MIATNIFTEYRSLSWNLWTLELAESSFQIFLDFKSELEKSGGILMAYLCMRVETSFL